MSSIPHQCLAVGQGSITRRRILEGLAAAAALAALPFKVEAAPAFKPIWLNQYTYVAPDMKATADWYVDVFGMQRGRTTAEETHLWFGDVQGDTLMRVRQAGADDTAPALIKFGFTSNYWDRDDVEAELNRRGLDPQPDTDQGFWFKDPEGNEIGVFSKDWMRRPAGLPPRNSSWRALSANHIVVTSADYKKLSGWYHDLIALNQTTDSGRDVVQWFGDTAWLPTQVRDGRQTSATLGTLDHCALTVADFKAIPVGDEMKRLGMIPESTELQDDDTGTYGVDPNDFKVQVCAWNEAPNQDRRRLQRALQTRQGGL